MNVPAAPEGAPPSRALPHPWDLHVDQCRGLRCVWCKTTLGDDRVPAGTTESVHQHGTHQRVVTFRLFSCPPCAEDGPS